MAITDNLVILIKAEEGQTVITDSISSLVVNTGAGTAANVDDATYGRLWRITGGAKSATFSSIGAITGGVFTVAIRFRVSTRSGYTKYVLLSSGGDASGPFVVGNAGSSGGTLRIGINAGTTAAALTNPASYTDGTVITAVLRFTEGATDTTATWFNTIGRVGTSPNATGSATYNFAASVVNYLGFNVTGETFDLLDFAVLTRGVTDAEGAALADDIRGTLYPSSGTAYTLALDAGSYSITGQSILAHTTLSLDLDTGSYSITGQDLSLLQEGSYRLNLEAGTYNIVSAEPNVGISMVLEAGTYTITGSTVRLVSSQDPVIVSKSQPTVSIAIRIGL